MKFIFAIIAFDLFHHTHKKKHLKNCFEKRNAIKNQMKIWHLHLSRCDFLEHRFNCDVYLIR